MIIAEAKGWLSESVNPDPESVAYSSRMTKFEGGKSEYAKAGPAVVNGDGIDSLSRRIEETNAVATVVGRYDTIEGPARS
jgi:hypothetical protein